MSSMITQFDRAYAQLAEALILCPTTRNRRTNQAVTSMHGFALSQDGVPLLTLRDVNPRWSCVEAVWFMYGSDDVSFMERFGFKAWSKFADTFGSVDSATGNRWRFTWDVDQLLWVVQTLRRDPSSRQCYLNTWDPTMDCWEPESKSPPPMNVPCLPAWHFWIDESVPRLNVSVFQRSCDIWYGLPADAVVISLVQAMIARHLEVEPGGLFLALSNVHLYEKQRKPMAELLARFDAQNAYAGSRLNHRLTLKKDLLPAALQGEEWVVEELWSQLSAFYDGVKQPEIAGGGMAV